MAGGRHVAGGAVARGREGLPGLRRRQGRARQRAHRARRRTVRVQLRRRSTLALAERPHGGGPALRRPDPPRRGRCRPARLASGGGANDAFTGFRFRSTPTPRSRAVDPITAQDVIASLERVMAAGDTSLAALSLEAVTGFRAFVDGKAEHVSGLTAPDDHTVRVRLDDAAVGAARGAVEPGAVGGRRGDRSPATTSATSTSAAAGRWPAPRTTGCGSSAATARPGSLDAVELRSFDDAEAAYDAFEDGDVDWATVPVEPLRPGRSRTTATTPSRRSTPSCSSG